MKKSKSKKSKWIKPHHQIVRDLVNLVLYPYSRIKYGLRVEKLKEGRDRQYLVLYNHQTAFDQFFVGMPFRKHLYYVASEDLFSNGFVSKLIKFLVEPIPIKKQSTDVRAIMTCIKVAKEGGSIAIAPEGNRTYSGKTEYMSPSIVPLARKLGLPIAICRIEGGYGVHPRWSDVVRRGKMVSRISKIVEPEVYAPMTDDELFRLISDELYVNEAKADRVFKHKRSAEYLERAIYICHGCGLSEFESHGDTLTCKRCGRSVQYTEKKELLENGKPFVFNFVSDWYDYQKDFIRKLDIIPYLEKSMYRDEVSVKEVIPYKRKQPVFDSADISLYANRIEISSGEERMCLPFDEVSSIAVLGKNKLNIYIGGKVYQFKGSKRFCALKYVHIYYKYVNVKNGEPDGEFLGL